MTLLLVSVVPSSFTFDLPELSLNVPDLPLPLVSSLNDIGLSSEGGLSSTLIAGFTCSCFTFSSESDIGLSSSAGGLSSTLIAGFTCSCFTFSSECDIGLSSSAGGLSSTLIAGYIC